MAYEAISRDDKGRRKMSSYSEYVEQRAVEDYIRDAIARKLRKGRSPEWIHEEDEYPMELILEVQADLESENHNFVRRGFCKWS